MAENSVKHVVVDSGGFIRNAPLREIGENIYTIKEVVSEIRDKNTRQRLQVLPYDIKFRQPSPDAISSVTEFAKKTGDYKSLSSVDLRVLALTYMLEKEHVGTENIRTQPLRKTVWTSTKKHLEKPTEIAGLYVGKKKSTAGSRAVSESQDSESSSDSLAQKLQSTNLNTVNKPETSSDNVEPSLEIQTDTGNKSIDNEFNEKNDKNNDEDESPRVSQADAITNALLADGDSIPVDCLVEEDLSDDENEDDEDSDDEDGWITPGNIKEVRAAMGDRNVEQAEVPVGCLTTDFSMQNVLIQMGLNVISVDGMLIKQAKSYVLRCHACTKITTNMIKEFCPSCGNKTLQRISMSVDEDGTVHYHLSRRKPLSTRGLKHSLPAPKGGKHACNPILCEDQREAQQRTAKASKSKTDVFDPDYVANMSPFSQNDITSRSAQIGIRDFRHNFRNKRNPNENKKVYGRRK